MLSLNNHEFTLLISCLISIGVIYTIENLPFIDMFKAFENSNYHYTFMIVFHICTMLRGNFYNYLLFYAILYLIDGFHIFEHLKCTFTNYTDTLNKLQCCIAFILYNHMMYYCMKYRLLLCSMYALCLYFIFSTCIESKVMQQPS